MQNVFKRFLPLLICLLAAGMVGNAAAQNRDNQVPAGASVNTCLTCHNNPGINGIRQTVHGQANVPGSPFARGGCTECHGSSENHLRSMQSPGVVFDDGTARFPPSPVAVQNQSCLNCHETRERVHWSGSEHQVADLACVTCHKIHSGAPGALRPAGMPDICVTCHLEKRAQFASRTHHPVPEGLMTCSSCHNPHGSDAPSLLAKASVVETCTQCHTEKRGPFLWEHQPVTEDCTTCHNPHGTTQASLLSVRQPFLCQGCHSEVFHPSTLYSGTGAPPAGAAQQLLGGACTNCHSAVHGSNHPSGSRLTR